MSIIVGSLGNSLLMNTTEGNFYAYFVAAFFASNNINKKLTT